MDNQKPMTNLTTKQKTVSACIHSDNCKSITDGLACDCTPTLSPTETVSDYSQPTGHGFMYVFNHSGCKQCLECVTNPPTEPTVEKWEIEFEDKFVPLMPGFSVAKDWGKTLPGVTANYMTLKSFIRHSVQEAKAEGFREGYERAKRELHPIHKVTGN